MSHTKDNGNIKQRLNRIADILRALAIIVLLLVLVIWIHGCMDFMQYSVSLYMGSLDDAMQQIK